MFLNINDTRYDDAVLVSKDCNTVATPCLNHEKCAIQCF